MFCITLLLTLEYISANIFLTYRNLHTEIDLNQKVKDMDFKDQLKQIADKISKLKDSTKTEEATKNAFVMPFISALGYDVFNPQEVIPEFTADIGIKVGEKVDYAILKDDLPIILIECKHWKDALDIHNTQLLRYFNVTKAKFAILTNGINYRFYTESEPNKMDVKPFLDINITEIKDNQIEELKKFHKSYFDTCNHFGYRKYFEIFK